MVKYQDWRWKLRKERQAYKDKQHAEKMAAMKWIWDALRADLK